jgi:hypothetical protein
MVLVRTVKPLGGYKVALQFNTGEEKVVDLLTMLRGPMFEPIRQNPVYFSSVHVHRESATICWDNGTDIDPDVLYGSHPPAWQEME